MASRIGRNYRYSLGEDIRLGAKKALLSVTLAGKGEDREENVHRARLAMMDVEMSLRLLSDLKVLPVKEQRERRSAVTAVKGAGGRARK